MTIGVYLIEHVATGRRYVGKSVDVQKRLGRHFSSSTFSHSSSLVHKAIAKYGRSAFRVVVLEDCSSEEEATAREILWIRELNTKAPSGFNLTDGGEGSSGHAPTPEARARMAASRVGRKHSEETKRKMSEALRGNQRACGRVLSNDERVRLGAFARAANQGRVHTPGARARMAASRVGRKYSPETIAKMCRAQQARRRAEKEAANA